MVLLQPDIVVTGSLDAACRIWSLRELKLIREKTCPGAVYSLARVSDELLISGGERTAAILWNATSGETVRSLSSPLTSARCIAVSDSSVFDSETDISQPKGDVAVISFYSGDLVIWNWRTGDVVKAWKAHAVSLWSGVFVDEFHIITASQDNTLKLWDLQSAECLRSFTTPEMDRGAIMTASDGSSRIVAADNRGCLRLFDIVTGDHLCSTVVASAWFGVWSLAMIRGCVVAVVRTRGVCIFDSNRLEPVRTIPNIEAELEIDMAIVDGTRIILCGCTPQKKTVLQIWDV